MQGLCVVGVGIVPQREGRTSRRPWPVPGSRKGRAPGNRVLGVQTFGDVSIPSVTQQPLRQICWALATDTHDRVADPMGPTATRPVPAAMGWAMAAGTMVAEASRAPAMNLVRVFMVYPRNDLATIAYYIYFVNI